jgi:hypothetical protein
MEPTISIGCPADRCCSPHCSPVDVPPDFGHVVDAAQKKAQDQLAKLVPIEKHVTNTNSGHEIHKEQPQLVSDAISEIVEAVRNRRRALPNSQVSSSSTWFR